MHDILVTLANSKTPWRSTIRRKVISLFERDRIFAFIIGKKIEADHCEYEGS
jgi:hypothetical protein